MHARPLTICLMLVVAVIAGGCSDGMEDTPHSEEPILNSRKGPVVVPRQATLKGLLMEEDTDGDRRITIDDPSIEGSERGDRRFMLESQGSLRLSVEGTYHLSNLLQELALGVDSAQEMASLDLEDIFERPVDRISRRIRELHWDALTRRVDRNNLETILPDEKSRSGEKFVYVPASESRAYRHFVDAPPETSLPPGTVIERLPTDITPEYVRSLEGRHGILVLGFRQGESGQLEGIPFVVPGGRFNEMYGWDSYFEALGLLADGRVELARGMVDNFIYQIRHYGKILNANRTYYLTRSQPPFLTSMALAVYEHLPQNSVNRDWLAEALRAAIAEYNGVWMSGEHLTDTGLSRYFGAGVGPPPEVEPGHFDAIFRRFAARHGMNPSKYERAYRAGDLREPELDRFFVHDRCVRESGHDTTYRWYDSEAEMDRCADFVTVDLNSLLFKYEIDIAAAIEDHFDGCLPRDDACERARPWRERAAQRRKAMRRYLWNGDVGAFFDFNTVTGTQSSFWSATTLYPLWASHPDDPTTFLLDQAEAGRLVANALAKLEQPGGLAASGKSLPGASRELGARQWDYPNGWAPHQMIAQQGLMNYGFSADAERLAYRWLYTITRNAYWYNGVIPEKYDVVKRSHQVFTEYGNVGTDFAYITREGFGWMNASYQVGLELLPATHREFLNRVVPPEWIFTEPLKATKESEIAE